MAQAFRGRKTHNSTNTTMNNPITDAVEAALIYAKFDFFTEKQYDSACKKLFTEITDQDRERLGQHSAAALRILADEVNRLRVGLRKAVKIIEHQLNTSL